MRKSLCQTHLPPPKNYSVFFEYKYEKSCIFADQKITNKNTKHNTMKKILLTASLLLSATWLMAQQDFVAAGGEGSSTAGTVSFSIGQTMASSSEGLTIGLQQAFAIEELRIDGVLPIDATLNLYPNPTSNSLTISTETDKTLAYELYSADGRRLATGNFARSVTLDVDHLPAGVYIVTISSDNKRQNNYKIVKQ